MKGRPLKGKYWYRFYVGECPVCGRDASYRERVYEKDKRRPKYWYKRHVQIPENQCYDWCVG